MPIRQLENNEIPHVILSSNFVLYLKIHIKLIVILTMKYKKIFAEK